MGIRDREICNGTTGWKEPLVILKFDSTGPPLTRFFFYKNILYKNIEAENPRKFKNILRIIRGSDQVGSNNSCIKAQCN